MIKETTLYSSPTPPETEINMATRQYGASPGRRKKTRSFHSFKSSFISILFIHFLLIFLFISICYESLLNVGKHAEVYTGAYVKVYVKVYAKAYVEASGSQEVLAMGRQDGARLACKGGIPLLLYGASISPYVGVLALGTLESTGAQRSQRGTFAYFAVL